MHPCLKLIPAALLMGLAAGPAAASEGNPPLGQPETPAALTGPSGTEQQAAAIVGLAPEFAAALAATGGKPSSAEREDRAALAKFYEARQYEPAWMTTSGVGRAGQAVMAELVKADAWGLEASAFRLRAMPVGTAELSRADRASLDVAISLAVLKYARHARGGRMDPNSLSKYIDRKPPLADPARVIDEAAKAAEADAYLRSLHPQHAQFERLRQKYLALARGQPMAQVEAAAPADDKANPGRKKAATGPEIPSARRLLVNMEQWRWMPESLGDYYVWVNIPEYTMRVVRGGKVIHTERVIVGKTDTQTPTFSDEMEQVIFHPFWGVPDSIKRADIQPSLARGSSRVLERYNLRIQSGGRDIDPESVDWASADMRKFHVYQPPGSGNALGIVKFRFPNKHDVYMHDTPTKTLFNAPVRTFSHGCMRVRDPQRLAELLLAEDQGWPANRIAAAIDTGPQNNHVNLKRKIPVHVTYFTAAVEDDGKLKLFPDIYDHESKVTLALDGKAHLIARWKEDKAPPQADAVSSLSETRTGGAKKDWTRRIFMEN